MGATKLCSSTFVFMCLLLFALNVYCYGAKETAVYFFNKSRYLLRLKILIKQYTIILKLLSATINL
jgi:hypothetical protein